MDVYPAGGDEQTVRLDLAFGCAGLAADRGQLATVDRDIACEGFAARAVQDRPAANDDVMHGFRLEVPLPRCGQHAPPTTLRQSGASHDTRHSLTGKIDLRRAAGGNYSAVS